MRSKLTLSIVAALTAVTSQVGGDIRNPFNALVPDAAPIQPAQAFVDNIGKFARGDTGAIAISDPYISHIAPASVATFDKIAQFAVGTGANINFSGCALPLADVNGILAQLAVNGNSTGTLNLTGGTNAIPTPVQSRINGRWTITITGTPVGTITLADANANTTTPAFGTDIDVTSADATTIATNTANFINGLAFAGWTASAASGVITVTVTADASLPLTAGGDSATNLTIADTAAGQPFIQNADKTTLESKTWAVTTN
jgi:hypothetical protein